jgi:hypothetical protein
VVAQAELDRRGNEKDRLEREKVALRAQLLFQFGYGKTRPGFKRYRRWQAAESAGGNRDPATSSAR